MNLQQELNNLAQTMQSMMSDDVKKTIAKTAQDLVNSHWADNALPVGKKIPSFSLPDATGKIINIEEILTTSKVVISFYRGGWCPYCNLELKALQESLSSFQGAELVAISPQTPDNSLSTVEKNQLTFPVLSDVGNHVAREFGLVYTVPEVLHSIYLNFGINLPEANGDKSYELPLPATYLLDQHSTILYSFVDADYTKRADIQNIIAFL